MKRAARSLTSTLPAARPLINASEQALAQQLEQALANADGVAGAHCVHEMWMRGVMSITIERALDALWRRASGNIPEWLPMRYIDWLPRAYEVASEFDAAGGRGRSNLYLVLLDYRDRVAGGSDYGVYVGMSRYAPAARFEQHKAGIRASGSVLKRGLEVLTGPVLHLQRIPRKDAERIEAGLAAALTAAGLVVKGGH